MFNENERNLEMYPGNDLVERLRAFNGDNSLVDFSLYQSVEISVYQSDAANKPPYFKKQLNYSPSDPRVLGLMLTEDELRHPNADVNVQVNLPTTLRFYINASLRGSNVKQVLMYGTIRRLPFRTRSTL